MNQAPKQSLPLSTLGVGQEGVLEASDDDAVAPRLRELGFVAGTQIRMVRRGLLGDPVEVELRGYRICLRTVDIAGLSVVRGAKVKT